MENEGGAESASGREEERTVSSEFIHVRLEAIPPLNVIGVYTCRQKKPKKCKRSWETKYKGV